MGSESRQNFNGKTDILCVPLHLISFPCLSRFAKPARHTSGASPELNDNVPFARIQLFPKSYFVTALALPFIPIHRGKM